MKITTYGELVYEVDRQLRHVPRSVVVTKDSVVFRFGRDLGQFSVALSELEAGIEDINIIQRLEDAQLVGLLKQIAM